MRKEIEKLVILKRTNPDIFEVHVNSIDRINNLLFSTRNEKLATGIVNGYNSLLTQPADVQERANEIEEPDYTMSDIKEHNPDYTGNKASKDAEDYAANILTEYPDEEYVRRTPSDIRCIAEAAHLAGASSLQAENERLRELVKDAWYDNVWSNYDNDIEVDKQWEKYRLQNNL